jgi:hypothetical protein
MLIKENPIPLPNPGSPAAISRGCLCPEDENNYGEGVFLGDCPIPEFWINLDCPLHGGYKAGKGKK